MGRKRHNILGAEPPIPLRPREYYAEWENAFNEGKRSDVSPMALGQPFQDFCHRVILSHDPIDPARAKIRIKKRSDSTVSFGGVRMCSDSQNCSVLAPGLSKCVHEA